MRGPPYPGKWAVLQRHRPEPLPDVPWHELARNPQTRLTTEERGEVGRACGLGASAEQVRRIAALLARLESRIVQMAKTRDESSARIESLGYRLAASQDASDTWRDGYLRTKASLEEAENELNLERARVKRLAAELALAKGGIPWGHGQVVPPIAPEEEATGEMSDAEIREALQEKGSCPPDRSVRQQNQQVVVIPIPIPVSIPIPTLVSIPVSESIPIPVSGAVISADAVVRDITSARRRRKGSQ